MATHKTYKVQRLVADVWTTFHASYGSKAFATGYFTAKDEYYPCPPLRVVSDTGDVIRESPGHGTVHLN